MEPAILSILIYIAIWVTVIGVTVISDEENGK